MKDDLLGELGEKCDMQCGGDGHNNSLWASRIAEGLLQAGLSKVSIQQPEAGLRGTFHTAELNVEMRNGEASRPGMAPTPEPAVPAMRDTGPKVPGAGMA